MPWFEKLVLCQWESSPLLSLGSLAFSPATISCTLCRSQSFNHAAALEFFRQLDGILSSASSASLQTRLPAVWILSPAILRGIYFQLGDVRYLRFAGCRFKSFLLFSTFRKNKGTKKVFPKCGSTSNCVIK